MWKKIKPYLLTVVISVFGTLLLLHLGLFLYAKRGYVPDLKPDLEKMTLVKDFVRNSVPYSEEKQMFSIYKKDGVYVFKKFGGDVVATLPADVAEAWAYLAETSFFISDACLQDITIQGDVIMFHTTESTYNAITFSPDGRAAVEKLTPSEYKVKRVMKDWYYAGVVGR